MPDRVVVRQAESDISGIIDKVKLELASDVDAAMARETDAAVASVGEACPYPLACASDGLPRRLSDAPLHHDPPQSMAWTLGKEKRPPPRSRTRRPLGEGSHGEVEGHHAAPTCHANPSRPGRTVMTAPARARLRFGKEDLDEAVERRIAELEAEVRGARVGRACTFTRMPA